MGWDAVDKKKNKKEKEEKEEELFTTQVSQSVSGCSTALQVCLPGSSSSSSTNAWLRPSWPTHFFFCGRPANDEVW